MAGRALSALLGLCGCGLVGGLPDLDQDGYTGADCAPTDAQVFPGAVETLNGKDDDCDGLVDEFTAGADDDGDGFSEQAGDCHDGDPAIHPDASEGPGPPGALQPNGLDDDCDGVVDEGTLGFDDDGDGWSELDGDCDDTVSSVHPGAWERCNDGDDDCDGATDEESDDDGDGFRDLDTCVGQVAESAESLDADDANPAVFPGAAELCDGLDNDQDGLVDEDFDADGDGFPWCGGPERRDCDDGDPEIHPDAQEVCDGGVDNDCDGLADAWDQDTADLQVMDLDGDGWTCSLDPDLCEGDPQRNAGATESWNGIDDDCDGATDEDFDWDGDGVAADGAWGTLPVGDCNDFDPGAYPGAVETCNGQDDDCDGQTDEGLTATFAPDLDGDGYAVLADAIVRCSAPTHYIEVDLAVDLTDCDDDNGDIHPGAVDECNGIDDSCSGDADDGGDCPCDVERIGGVPYLFCLDDASWEEARDACEAVDNYALVSIETSLEQVGIEAGLRTANWDVSSVWTSGTDLDCDLDFEWGSGAKLSAGYLNWAAREPNYSGGCEAYLELYPKDGTWNNETGNVSNAYICEANP